MSASKIGTVEVGPREVQDHERACVIPRLPPLPLPSLAGTTRMWFTSAICGGVRLSDVFRDKDSALMSDELDAWGSVQMIRIATPCAVTSPLISSFGSFGFALDCEKQSGHDGQHGRILRWFNGVEVVGQIDASWD